MELEALVDGSQDHADKSVQSKVPKELQHPIALPKPNLTRGCGDIGPSPH